MFKCYNIFTVFFFFPALCSRNTFPTSVPEERCKLRLQTAFLNYVLGICSLNCAVYLCCKNAFPNCVPKYVRKMWSQLTFATCVAIIHTPNSFSKFGPKMRSQNSFPNCVPKLRLKMRSHATFHNCVR